MSTYNDLYCSAGETLELAQILEESLITSIMMLFIIESGFQKDVGPDEALELMNELKRTGAEPKIQKIDEKFRQSIKLKRGQILLKIRNDSMGTLKRELESRLHVSPGGPSAHLRVLQDALDARNELCHEFFKKYGAHSLESNSPHEASIRAEEIKDKIQRAISFLNDLTEALRKEFPKTFTTRSGEVH